MTHYQKLATMIFPILSVLAISASLILWIMSAVTTLLLPKQLPQPQQSFILFSFLPHIIYLIVGIFLLTASRSLAKWICSDFDS